MRYIFLVFAYCTAASCEEHVFYSGGGKTVEEHPSITKKRLAPAKVRPVTVGKLRYEVIPFGKDRGFQQDSGILRAVSTVSGAELWTLQLF